MAEQLGWGVANQVLEGVNPGHDHGGVFGTGRRRVVATVNAMPTAGDRPTTRAAPCVCCVDFFVEHLEETVFHARLRLEVLTEYVGAHFVGDAQGVQRWKLHIDDPHPGVTGQLEYDHPVSYEVAVAKKPAEPEQLAAEAAASAARPLAGAAAARRPRLMGIPRVNLCTRVASGR